MKLMSNMKKLMFVFALTVGMSLSLVSATPRQVTAVQATAAVEVQTVGGMEDGDGCSAAFGVAAGLAVGALSPCSIVCLGGAWYVFWGAAFAGCGS
jgi:hypothetical protein